MFDLEISSETVNEAWQIIQTQFPIAIWETVYVTFLATAFSIVIGLPLGVLLVAGEKGGVLPLPSWLMRVLNAAINLLRSVPFLILMILVFPLTRLIVGTVVGTIASIVPLVIAAFPFVARLAESSLREVNPNVIEMAQSMGASPLQIIVKVMIPESVPSLISNATIAITTILGYYYMAETNVAYLNRYIKKPVMMTVCKAIFIGTVAFGAINASTLIWTMADVGVGTMAWLNIIAIFLLQKPAFLALQDYEAQLREGRNPVFHPELLGIERATYWEGGRAEANLAVEEASGVDNLTGLDPKNPV